MPPPKKGTEAPPPDVQEVVPSLESDGYLEDLLMKAKERDAMGVEKGVAAALRIEDHKVDITNGVLVDYVVEGIMFAAQHGFGPRKTVIFLQWMKDLRLAVEEGDIGKARDMFKEFMIQNAERGANAGAEALPPASPVGDASADKPKKPEPKKKSAAATDDTPLPQRASDTANYITTGEMGVLSDFVVTGLLQHWRLYAYVAKRQPMAVDSATFTVSVQQPARPPPLARALPLEQHAAAAEEQKKKEAAELQALLDLEAAAREAARAEEERLLAEQLRWEQEQKDNQIALQNKGTEAVVLELEGELKERTLAKQQAVLERLQRVEELMNKV